MKFIVLFLLFPLCSLSQDTIEIHTVSKDIGVVKYVIQDSTNKKWDDYITLQPKKLKDSNVYVCILSNSKYFRVVSNMVSGKDYITGTFIINNSLNLVSLSDVTIYSTVFNDYLSFTIVEENNVSKYLIQKSNSKKPNWNTVTTIKSTGLSKYVITVGGKLYRSFGYLSYRVIPVFKDNVQANYYIFK